MRWFEVRRVITALVISIAPLLGAEPNDTMPIEARRALIALDTTIITTKEKTAQTLAKIAIDLGKRGDLDGALQVKREADRLAAEVRAARPLGKPNEEAKAAFLIGEWTAGNEWFRLAADGTYTGQTNNPDWSRGRWEVNDAGDTVTLILDVNGTRQPFTIVDQTRWQERTGKIWTKRP